MENSTENKLINHLEYFYLWEKNDPNRVFLKQPKRETWKTLSYKEVGQEARKLVAALQSMGLKKGDIALNEVKNLKLLKPGSPIKKGDILFKKIESE